MSRVMRIAPVSAMVLALCGGASAQAPVPDFASFAAGLRAANASETAVAAEARAYLQRFYDGMTVRQTVRDEDGRILDCVRPDQQPALRLQGLRKVDAAPPFAPPPVAADVLAAMPAQPRLCASGTFPIQRLTLDRILRAGSLRDFFRKAPADTSGIVPPNSGGHAYSFAYQYVASTGGQTTESLYSPKINLKQGEIFSLEQQWYIAGSGAGTQTAEVGWQAYPALYNTPKSVLFSYFTADDYSTTGCYNYDCGAFVQLADAPISLAVPFSQYSKAGGRQVGIAIGYQLYQQKWYLYYGGSWVGYYPVSVYRNGPLATSASLFELGTETVGSTIWPPAASGQFPSAGYPNAGYQFGVSLLNAAGTSFTPVLTQDDPSPTCYATSTPKVMGKHGYGFLVGGPGGKGC